MARDEQLKARWDLLVQKLSDQFADGDPLDVDGIIYLIGIQELGKFNKKFKKDEKVNILHIAICVIVLNHLGITIFRITMPTDGRITL